MLNLQLLRSMRNRSFACLWGGQFLSRIGDHLYEIALAWWVLEETQSAGAMAMVFVFTLAPTVLMTLLGGVMVDRFPRIQIMIMSDVIRGAAAGIISVLVWSGDLQLWQVYLLSFIFGTLDAFFQPAYVAVIPDIVDEADLPSANSLTSLSAQLGRIAGPALGAVITNFGGVALAFALNAVSFLAAAALLFPLLRTVSRKVPVAAEANLWRDLKVGISEVANTRWLWIAIITFALINVTLLGPYSVGLPFLVDFHLGGEVGALGFLYSMFALGYIIGGLWLGQQTELVQGRRLLYGGVIIAGLALSVFGVPSIGLWALAAAAVVNGIALQIAALTWTNILQTRIPSEKLGRVASVDMLGSFTLMPIGYALAGWATEAIGAPALCALGGLLTALAAALANVHPSMRALDVPHK